MPKKRAKQKAKTGASAPAFVYVPEAFDPKTALPADLHRYGDCARYFLHRIIWGRVQRKLTADQFVLIKFDYLRAVIPDRVIKPLKHALIDAGVIECDSHYIEGCKSFGYRLCPPYSEGRIVRTPLSDRATAEKLRTSRRAEFKKIKLDVHKYLRDQYRRLEIDLPLALKLLQGHRHFEVVKVPVEQIAAKDFSFSVCRYGRVHTDLTQSPKRIRPALRIDGQSLVEIDVANSQPLFLALLLINHRKYGNKTFAYVTFPEDRKDPYHQIDEIIHSTVLHFDAHEEGHQYPPPTIASITTRKEWRASTQVATSHVLADNEHTAGIGMDYQRFLKRDELQYVKLCQEGRLYEDFMARLAVYDRNCLKKWFFEFLYSGNRFRSSLKEDFCEVYPNVAEVVRAHKRKDHAFLPRLMQNIEANFIVNTVCRRLMNEMPDAPVLTIHDCLLTTPAFAEDVMEVMREEFARLGLLPRFHIKAHGERLPKNCSVEQ